MGDVVLDLDDRPVRNGAELTTALAELDPGHSVTLGVIRYGSRLDIVVELEEFEAGAKPERPAGPGPVSADLLGFRVQSLTPALARQAGIRIDKGLLITEVDPLGPAAQAGLRPGLVLQSVSGQAVSSPPEVDRVRRAVKPGDAVSLVVRTDAGDFILNFIARR